MREHIYNVKNWINKALNPNNYGFILALFIILLLPTLFVAFLSTDLAESIVKKIAYLSFAFLIYLIPALFLKLRWYFLLVSVFMLAAPFEIGYVWFYKATSTDGYISSLLNTNRSEAREMLFTMKEEIAFLFIIWFAYFYIVFKKIKNNFLFKIRFSILTGVVFFVFNLLLFSSMFILEYRRTHSDIRMDAVVDNFLNKYRKTYPCNYISTLIRKQKQARTVQRMQIQMASFSFDAQQPALPDDQQIFVVVIGESARYGNFSINGYARETSPLLAKRNDLLTFSDVFASSNLTEYTFPFLLSRATPLTPEVAYKEKTFIEAFMECGFYTAWIANQASYYPYIDRIAKTVDRKYFSFNDFDQNENYDGLLLKAIDSVLDDKAPKTLIVVHTLGSHFRYNFRYPKSFEKFTPALEGVSDYSILSKDNKTLIINSYDNTILYTDYVLSEIINRIDSRNSVAALVYFSDHAENLYDDDRALVLHGSKNPSVNEIHVPLFVWTSAKYKSFYEDKQKSLEANINKKISLSNLFYSILDIAGISYPGEELEKSFASGSFKEDSVRYVYTANQEVIHF